MTNQLNSVLARWLEQSDLDLAARQLNCDVCSKGQMSSVAQAQRWHLYKCCTFQPFVANFLLGAHLAGGGKLPALTSRVHLTPLGLFASHEYKQRHAALPEEAHGPEQLCAFYQDRKCGIFSFRPGECSTYFCTGVDPLLSERSFAVEVAVAQLALLQQGLSYTDVGRQIDLLNEPEHGIGQPVALHVLEAMYVRAWSFASGLSRAEVEAALGAVSSGRVVEDM